MRIAQQNKQDFQLFFPRMRLEEEGEHLNGIQDSERYELLVEKKLMLPFVQTLFFEERLIEIQVDHGTRIFFGALWDHLPDLEEQEADGVPLFVEPEYQEGSYLKELDHLVLSPLEPVVGNLKVRTSSTVLLCFYAGTNAVELGTRFLRADTIQGTSVLIFEYPIVGRIIRGNRPFRAKLPNNLDMMAHIRHFEKHDKGIDCDIIDISSHGLSLEHEQLMEKFHIGDKIVLTILSPFDKPLEINGTIRHFARIRTKQGNSNVCGVQLDLESRALAGIIEELFAKIQRVFIRSLSERTEGQNIHLTLQ
jgi:PilZ domain